MVTLSTLTMLAVLTASHVALLTALLLLATQHWHGRHSLDISIGVQKFHIYPTTRVGGVAVVVGLVVASFVAKPEAQALLWPLLLAGLPAFVFGLVEDITKQVSVRARLLATMACGVLGWAITGYSITDANLLGLDWLLGFTVVSVLFTAFAVGGVANAINIIDGFNGLAAGTVIIILCSFAFMASALGDPALKQTSLIIAGAVLGFGLLNWPMGKIFLGDGGAYFIGFALAWLAVLLLARHPEVSAWAPLLVCGYPVLEVGFSILRRHRRGVSTGHPDRLHLHSLVKRRVARRLMPGTSNLVRNSTTGAIMWLPALLPTLIAVNYPGYTPTLVLGWLLCALLYSAVYARLTQFRWCFSAATLQAKPVNV
ncbi:glycosyltransferase [Rhodoferax sp.]|uniref:MraY family glycosyltransferase n=1 Tax=Rhodoferax sp. TaxID=50421 RepID=UPI002733FCA3|nr:glycosyltransferase [Rhodoferax sp.]MDP3190353.1 glycosyltransferase [Rhodoferax sp.]MDP3335420.1 glycosyltransferase [Rhodoferax sp.]